DALSGILTCYVGAGKQNAARACAEQFLASDPLHVHAWLFKGAVEWFDGDFDASRRTLTSAVELFPEGLYPRWQLAYVLALGGHHAESARHRPLIEEVDAASPYTTQLCA